MSYTLPATKVRHYYPACVLRCQATIGKSLTDDENQLVDFVIAARSVQIERNDFNTADKCTMELDVFRFPLLPRTIRQVLVQAYAGDLGTLGTTPELESIDLISDDFVRFVGYVDGPEMFLSESEGRISWTARDFTALFLGTRRPLSSVIPTYSTSLKSNLRAMVDSLPGGENIEVVIETETGDADLTLAAPAGMKDKKIPTKPDDNLWALVKRACDPVGLIPQIKLDKLVVAPSRGLRTPERRPVFVYGGNVIEYKESRNLEKLKEGIGLQAWGTSTGKHIVALYPTKEDKEDYAFITKHAPKPATTKKGKPRKPPPTAGSNNVLVDPNEKRTWFPYGSVANENELREAAKRVFEERSRQEFEGQLKCARMVVPEVNSGDSLDGGDFDVTQLANGDRVMIDVLPDHQQMLGALDNSDQRTSYLLELGYEADLASVLVQAYESGMSGPLEVYVKRATHNFNEPEGYTLTLDFENLIEVGASGIREIF